MIVEVDGKLTAHLRGHERMCDALTFEVIVQVWKVQTDVITNDIESGTAGQRGVQIHHADIETVAGVCSHLVFGLHIPVAVAPVAEAHQIAVLQLAAFGRTSRTGGVEQDEQR